MNSESDRESVHTVCGSSICLCTCSLSRRLRQLDAFENADRCCLYFNQVYKSFHSVELFSRPQECMMNTLIQFHRCKQTVGKSGIGKKAGFGHQDPSVFRPDYLHVNGGWEASCLTCFLSVRVLSLSLLSSFDPSPSDPSFCKAFIPCCPQLLSHQPCCQCCRPCATLCTRNTHSPAHTPAKHSR